MLRLMLLGATTLVAALIVLPALAVPNAQTIRVTETNYAIALSAKPRAGTVRFIVRNNSDEPHNFYVKGGGKLYRSKTILLKGTTTLTAKLRKGVAYSYWCAVSDHAEEGMRGSFVAR